MNTGRRQFSKKLFGTVLSFSLLESLIQTDAIAKGLQPVTSHWAKQLNDYCLDLKTQSISQVAWQNHVEALFGKVPLHDLLAFIDFEQLTGKFHMPDLGVGTKKILFPKLECLPQQYAFHKKLFGLQKDRAIIPHGHSNMASAHLVLKGEFELRHYDKVEEEKDHLIIKPTIEKTANVGSCSSISDEKDNIHWFINRSEQAFTFDVIMLDLRHKAYDIHNIDPLTSEKAGDGLLRARKLDVDTALKKYGKSIHH
ncbi:MAG: hypothetical protein AAFX87_17115 [Bacteroidota bacterium]